MEQQKPMRFILIRTPRTNEKGDSIRVNITMEREGEFDLTGYSFLQSFDTYDEWVPTAELSLYKAVFQIK